MTGSSPVCFHWARTSHFPQAGQPSQAWLAAGPTVTFLLRARGTPQPVLNTAERKEEFLHVNGGWYKQRTEVRYQYHTIY
jgi:hypothetical protein